MIDRWVRLGLIAGIIGPVLYFAIQPALIPFYPGYDWTRQVVSELGAEGAPTAAVFNPAVILIGVMMTAGGIAQTQAFRAVTAWPLGFIAGVCVAAVGLATIVAGLFPLPDARHAAGGPLVFVGVIYPALALAAFRKDQRWRWAFAICGAGVVIAVLIMTGAIEVDRARWQGLIQRPTALAVFGPMALASWASLRRRD